MAEITANPVLDKILVALDHLVRAKEETTVRRMEQEISVAIQHAEDEFGRTFTLPGRCIEEEANLMNGTTPEHESSSLSAQHFELFIKRVAEHFSELRRLGDLLAEHRRRLASIRDIWELEAEMVLDWSNACDFMALKVIEGNEIDLTQLEPASYPVLEDSWLHRVKEMRAYYIWEKKGSGNDDADYFEASSEIWATP